MRNMVEVINKEYWSRSDAFLLPLTGISKTNKYEVKSYLFWENYSIEDYQLILSMKYDNFDSFLHYCKKMILPVIGQNGLIEIHDAEDQSLMIIDLSLWSFDIEMFLSAKYSKMSKEAKSIIMKYHQTYDKGFIVPINIQMALEPNKKERTLDNKTPLEYLADTYGFDLTELQRIGEAISPFIKENETLSGVVCQEGLL